MSSSSSSSSSGSRSSASGSEPPRAPRQAGHAGGDGAGGAHAPRPPRPLALLVVEDSEDDVELLLRAVRRGGFDVRYRVAETAAEMRKALLEVPFDLVVSDYSLPTFDAISALRLAQECAPDVPLLIVSGTIGEDTAVAALQAGARDFIVKGNLARLVPAIERELREREVRVARRGAEQALRESEARYRRIVETTNEGVWLLDPASLTTFVNGRMATLLGHAPEHLIGRDLRDFVHPDSQLAVERMIERRQTSGGQVEVRFVRKDGADVWALVDSTPIADATGRHEGMLAMVMDISLHKRLEEQLRQAQKMEAIGNLRAASPTTSTISSRSSSATRASSSDRSSRAIRSAPTSRKCGRPASARASSRASSSPSAGSRCCSRRPSISTRSSSAWRGCCGASSARRWSSRS